MQHQSFVPPCTSGPSRHPRCHSFRLRQIRRPSGYCLSVGSVQYIHRERAPARLVCVATPLVVSCGRCFRHRSPSADGGGGPRQRPAALLAIDLEQPVHRAVHHAFPPVGAAALARAGGSAVVPAGHARRGRQPLGGQRGGAVISPASLSPSPSSSSPRGLNTW